MTQQDAQSAKLPAAPEGTAAKAGASAEVEASLFADTAFTELRPLKAGEWFETSGAQVILQRRNLLGFWKASGAPFSVCMVGVDGLSFRNFGVRMDVGTVLRLSILLPGKAPMTVRGAVIWNKEHAPTPGMDGGSVHAHICGVKFSDYGAEAWSVLTDVCNAHAKEAQHSKSPNGRQPGGRHGTKPPHP
jgi:hypothetical protein